MPTYSRVIFARDTHKNARLSQFQLFKDLINKFPQFRNRFRINEAPVMRITAIQSGNMIIGGSFDQPDSLRSIADPTDFWAEEPITRHSSISRDSFLDIQGSLRNPHGVPTIFHFTFNPISKSTWIYEDFFVHDLYDAEKVFANYWDNPFCPPELINFLNSLKVIDPKRYEVDALGNWGVSFEGLIYTDWEAVDSMPPPQVYGLDFGYNNPTALVAAAVEDVPGEPKERLYWKELLYKTKLTAPDLIVELNKLNINRRIPIICDSARPEIIQDLRRAGFMARPCRKFSGSVKSGITDVLEYSLKIVRPSRNLLDEIATYHWDGDDDGNLGEEPAPRQLDHALDAGRYATEYFKPSGGRFVSV